MQKNPKLLIFVGIFSIVLIVGLIWTSAKQSKSTGDKTISNEQLIQDKASGDTENEVLRTVLANQEQLKAENKSLKDQNDQLRQKGLKSVDEEIQGAKDNLQKEIQALKSHFESKITDDKQTISNLKKSVDEDQGEYPINGDNNWNSNDISPHVITTVSDLSDTLNENTSKDQLETQTRKTQTANQEPILPSDVENTGDQIGSDKEKSVIPYYTMPANSTINHVKLMTSIIGEVPVSGKLLAPAFPFKAIIGKKELFAANGMSLPSDLAGTVLEGYSVGNMTLSCARLYVTRILFVFNDGHFVVYPKQSDNDSATSLYPQNALGYLSDSYGNTCLAGKYITDAPKVLANLALLGGISTGANAVASAQFTTVNNGQSLTSALTGSMPKLVGASMVGGGTQEILQWYKQRVDDVFDAIYIPSSFNHHPTNLVFNITNTIPIDLNKHGRTLEYDNAKALSDHFRQLD